MPPFEIFFRRPRSISFKSLNVIFILNFKTSSRYSRMLRDSVLAWPKLPLTIVAIETISRAFNATLAHKEYANEEIVVSYLTFTTKIDLIYFKISITGFVSFFFL